MCKFCNLKKLTSDSLLENIFLAGVDTSAVTVEAELARNPRDVKCTGIYQKLHWIKGDSIKRDMSSSRA